ncbi:Butyrophilin subfamily 3 member A3, partial [Ophiophagus hannah]
MIQQHTIPIMIYLQKMPGEERHKLVHEFEQFHQVVKDQMQFLLSHLEELKINILDYQKKNHARHTANTIELNTLIGDIERKCDQPEVEFLKQMTQVNSLVSNLEKLCKQLPEERLKDTLSHMLVLSSDQTTVKWNAELKEKIPYHWMRFEKDACVLGSEGFASGRIYWEINVEKGKIWAVGVAKESVEKKHLIKFAPENGIWGLGLDEQKKYMAYTNSGVVPLDLSKPLRKIRVKLDYTAGQVSFFNAGTNGWIFTFPPANFSGENIYPWFWVKGGLLKLPAIDMEELAADLVWRSYSEVPLYGGDPLEFFNESW